MLKTSNKITEQWNGQSDLKYYKVRLTYYAKYDVNPMNAVNSVGDIRHNQWTMKYRWPINSMMSSAMLDWISWLVILGLTALWDSISVYIGPSPKEREKEKWQTREKMSKQPPPPPTASAVGPCPTLIQISRTPRHWKLIQHHRITHPPKC